MALHRIGMTLGDQFGDHGNHRPDIIGRARLVIGAHGAQSIHIGVIHGDGFGGPLVDQSLQIARIAGVFAREGCVVDLVIHIGEIADIGDMRCAVDMPQQAVKHIKHHHRAAIAQMRAVIDRGPAEIHAQVFWVQRHEILLGAGFAIVQFDRHIFIPISLRTLARAGLSSAPEGMN